MIMTEVESSSTNGAMLSTSQSKVLNKDDFLNLLIAQLQHQDPLNPADSTEFTAQLAQFSSLEQLGNVNDNLLELKNFQASINNSQAVTLIGKSITANGNSIQLGDDVPVQIDFTLEEPAAQIVVSIYDGAGNYVAELKSTDQSAGFHSLSWNGTDNDGKRLANGNYTFTIQAEDGAGQAIKATGYYSGTVDKVIYEGNTSYLISGNQKIALGNVIAVTAPPNAIPANNTE